MKGQIVEVRHYTPGINTGQRLIIEAEVPDPQGPMMVVREFGTNRVLGPFWDWRFRRVIDEMRQ